MSNYDNGLTKAQNKASKKITKVLQKNGLALLWGQIRSGKTRSFLNSARGYKTLVVTKKNAVDGILSEAKELGVEVDVINYHSIQKKNPNDYTLIILDECHLYISPAQAKPSTIWKEVVKFTRKKFIIYASGTPTPEGYAGLYHMMALSTWTPLPFPRFTKFFEEYGIPSTTYTGQHKVPCYKLIQEKKLISKIEHLIVNLTRKKMGHVHEAEDVYHAISMNKQQIKILKHLKKHKVYIKDDVEILADTPVKELIKAHQVSGGIGVKGEVVDDNMFWFKKVSNKVAYILDNFDADTTIILSHYKHEQDYLRKVFPHTGSVTKMSTGVDLSHYKTMIIFSMAFSSANYEQVKGRLMNIKRNTPIKVHYLVSGIDEYIIKAVKNKENFTSRWYRKNV